LPTSARRCTCNKKLNKQIEIFCILVFEYILTLFFNDPQHCQVSSYFWFNLLRSKNF
jgi:hypothetical protein